MFAASRRPPPRPMAEEEEEEEEESGLDGEGNTRPVFQTLDGESIGFMLHKSLLPGQKRVLAKNIMVRAVNPAAIHYVVNIFRILGTWRYDNGDNGRSRYRHC